MKNSSDFLPFNEFKKRDNRGMPKYNNFSLLFSDSSGAYQKKKHYIQLQNRAPDLCQELNMLIPRHCKLVHEKVSILVDSLLAAEEGSYEKKRLISEFNDLKFSIMEPFHKRLYIAYKILKTLGYEDNKLF